MEKDLLFFLVFSLMLIVAYPIRDVSMTPCSSKFEDELHNQLNDSGLHFTLHHPRSLCFLTKLPLTTLLSHDMARSIALASRLSSKPHHHNHTHSSPLIDRSNTPSSSTPLSPGTSIGVGNYITRIGLGTPQKSYVMVVDTGSSLTWLQCSPCRISCHEQLGPLYNPTSSSTYRSVSCSAQACTSLEAATLNPSACSISNICIYQASYGDSSFSVGYLSTDTLTLGSGQSFPGFIYGCGQDNEGLFGKSAGLIGLARNKLSLLSQLAPKLGNSFSYCLPTTQSTGYLSIGVYNPAGFAFTPIVPSSLDNSLYFLKLTGITVGGKVLPVSSSAYSSTPMIIDSGTVITRLPSDVYTSFSGAIVKALSGYKRAPAFSILDTCFKGSLGKLSIPEVSMVFQGGAKLQLKARNVMFDIDDSTTCLAFASAGKVGIIGNRQQQTFKVVYDVANSKIGFAPGGCS